MPLLILARKILLDTGGANARSVRGKYFNQSEIDIYVHQEEWYYQGNIEKFFNNIKDNMMTKNNKEKLKEDIKKDTKKGIWWNTSLAAPGALAHRLQRRTACKTQNGHQGAPKWPTGSEKGSNPRFLGAVVNFP